MVLALNNQFTVSVSLHFNYAEILVLFCIKLQAMSAYGYEIVQTLIVDIEPDIHVKRAMNEINAGMDKLKSEETSLFVNCMSKLFSACDNVELTMFFLFLLYVSWRQLCFLDNDCIRYSFQK